MGRRLLEEVSKPVTEVVEFICPTGRAVTIANVALAQELTSRKPEKQTEDQRYRDGEQQKKDKEEEEARRSLKPTKQ